MWRTWRCALILILLLLLLLFLFRLLLRLNCHISRSLSLSLSLLAVFPLSHFPLLILLSLSHQIYNEMINDLLGGTTNLRIHEDAERGDYSSSFSLSLPLFLPLCLPASTRI